MHQSDRLFYILMAGKTSLENSTDRRHIPQLAHVAHAERHDHARCCALRRVFASDIHNLCLCDKRALISIVMKGGHSGEQCHIPTRAFLARLDASGADRLRGASSTFMSFESFSTISSAGATGWAAATLALRGGMVGFKPRQKEPEDVTR